MNKKKKLILGVCIIFCAYILLQIIGLGTLTVIGNESQDITQKISGFLLVAVSVLMNNPFAIIIAVALIVAISKANFIKYDKNDLKKYEGYYRDIIGKYSVAALSYIDDFKVDEKTVISTIMQLERKNIIECSDKIRVLNDDVANLTESERFILQLIQSNNLNNINYESFKEQIVLECRNKELLKDNNEKTKFDKILKLMGPLMMVVVFLGFFSIIGIACFNSEIYQIAFSIYIVLFVVGVFSVFVVAISRTIYDKVGREITPYVRTKIAKKINENLEGLKNYIKDFSNLNEKDKEALTLWNEYLIYSVMFGQNTKVIQEYKSKF